ncbi:MAG: hypothetical protein ABH969_03060 [Pseudomonadota bacterium]
MKEGEIHPPVRAGQSLPGPGGEVLRAGQSAGVQRFKESNIFVVQCGKKWKKSYFL